MKKDKCYLIVIDEGVIKILNFDFTGLNRISTLNPFMFKQNSNIIQYPTKVQINGIINSIQYFILKDKSKYGEKMWNQFLDNLKYKI